MELLGIGPPELVLIIVLALIIFSPKDLANGGRSIGRFLNRLYRSESYKAMHQVSQELQTLPSRLAREAQLEDLQELGRDIQAPILSPAADEKAAGASLLNAPPDPEVDPGLPSPQTDSPQRPDSAEH